MSRPAHDNAYSHAAMRSILASRWEAGEANCSQNKVIQPTKPVTHPFHSEPLPARGLRREKLASLAAFRLRLSAGRQKSDVRESPASSRFEARRPTNDQRTLRPGKRKSPVSELKAESCELKAPSAFRLWGSRPRLQLRRTASRRRALRTRPLRGRLLGDQDGAPQWRESVRSWETEYQTTGH